MASDATLTVCADPAALADTAANLIIDVATEAVRERGRFMLCLAGGETVGGGVPVPRSFGGSQSGEVVLKGSPLGVGLREVEGSPVRVPGLIITSGAAQ